LCGNQTADSNPISCLEYMAFLSHTFPLLTEHFTKGNVINSVSPKKMTFWKLFVGRLPEELTVRAIRGDKWIQNAISLYTVL
jgi:hypothetical protein